MYLDRPQIWPKSFAQRNHVTFRLKSVLRPNFSSAKGSAEG